MGRGFLALANFRMLTLAHSAYTITEFNGTVHCSPAGGVFGLLCLPEPGNPSTLGLTTTADSLNTQTFSYTLPTTNQTIAFTFTQADNIPVRTMFTAGQNPETSLQFFYYNTKPGVPDPSVFDVPPQCQSTAQPTSPPPTFHTVLAHAHQQLLAAARASRTKYQ
eukprot:m.198960 g.198960  ORF g.198960 m.198960 type:complete len:164 (+) comp21889_c5_seq1:439-930(+)